MSKKILIIMFVLIIVSGVTATGLLFLFPYQPDQPPIVDDKNATQEGTQEVVNAINQFAFDLYYQLEQSETGNIFYSPYSVFSALAMTYEGAIGETAEEMESVLHFPEVDTLRANFAAIYNNINKEDKEFELRTGNALWVQQDYHLIEDYLNRVERYYGGKASNLDFIEETEKSRQTINSFIEEQTNGKIKDLIPEGAINELTRLVLTNAIYFKGTWEWEFDKSDTIEEDFKITPNEVVKTQMMHMDPDKATFNYAELEKLQILELPYKGEKISMLILLPKQGETFDYETGELIVYNYTLEDIELSSEKLSEYKSQMKETKLDSISLPKFEFDTKYFMKDTLSSMGMSTAFSESADFSGMTADRDLFISQVIHQAYVKVDEEGTEAAAATSVGMVTTGIPRNMNIFNADHPFVFIIQEKETGAILFLGKVVNPTL